MNNSDDFCEIQWEDGRCLHFATVRMGSECAACSQRSPDVLLCDRCYEWMQLDGWKCADCGGDMRFSEPVPAGV